MSSGDKDTFRKSWKIRPETRRYHFNAGPPQHQVQFAFQNHWRLFRQFLYDVPDGPVLEVGAGRGSMSAYFAHAGYETILLDTSEVALWSGRSNFEQDNLTTTCIAGDALHLPCADASMAVVLSIGLLEHFASIEGVLAEKHRVLKPGGVMLNYIVPERPLSVQTLAAPVNSLLKVGHRLAQAVAGEAVQPPPQKPALYRNDYTSRDYLRVLEALDVREAGHYGTFPVPMISHSVNFPFTPMHPLAEKALMQFWHFLLSLSSARTAQDPWVCPEEWGLAFVVWARK